MTKPLRRNVEFELSLDSCLSLSVVSSRSRASICLSVPSLPPNERLPGASERFSSNRREITQQQPDHLTQHLTKGFRHSLLRRATSVFYELSRPNLELRRIDPTSGMIARHIR